MAEHADLQTSITAVTVFRDGARVARSGRISLQPGLRPVQFGALPESADPASVRVSVRGTDVALAGVDVRRGYGVDPLREEAARLRVEVERWQDAVAEAQDAETAEKATLAFSDNLSKAAADAMARAVSYGRAGHEDLTRIAAHISQSTADALARRREIRARQRIAQQELQAAEQRLAEAERRAAGPAGFIGVTAMIEVGAAADAELELSYHVLGASWRPLYDISLVAEQLTVDYLAEVTQRTGEDWPAVPLALSTTRRGQHQVLPELQPWYIGRVLPVRAPTAAGVPLRHSQAAFSETTLEPPPRAPRPAAMVAAAQAAPLIAEVDETDAGVVYQTTTPLSVPADGSPHKAMIAQLDMAAAVDHLAIPVLAAEAYMRAKVTNTSRLLLLPGRARIFHDSQFAGETSLETIASGEEFELQLGVDDQIRIERELRRRATSKAVIGGARTVDIAYEITVRNHRPVTARVSVQDRLPVSSDGEIKVRLRDASPAPSEHTDLGRLTWDLELGSGQTATIRHRFTVEHPAQVTVSGL